MKKISEKIRETITKTRSELLKISSETVHKKTSPDAWSKKEILGHLIDSAANNHQRFVRGAQNVAQDFPAYHQDRWVEVQCYNDMNWVELVDLFYQYNLHLCRVIDRLPRGVLDNPCNIGKNDAVALRFVIEDYFRHIEHHIKDIVGPSG